MPGWGWVGQGWDCLVESPPTTRMGAGTSRGKSLSTTPPRTWLIWLILRIHQVTKKGLCDVLMPMPSDKTFFTELAHCSALG